MATIFIPTPLRRFAADQARVDVHAGTAGEALHALVDAHPALAEYLYDEARQVRKHVRLYIGEDDIREKQGLSTPIQAGDQLSIIPAIAGGATS